MNNISPKSDRQNNLKTIPLNRHINIVTPGLHQDARCQNMGWYNVCLPKQQGKSHFRCFKICKEVSFTKSYYHGTEPLFSKIHYPYDITLMVFGLKGKSHLGLSPTHLEHTINAGDIWLFNLSGHHVYRFSPPNLCHEMAVLKFPTERLKQAFADSDDQLLSIFELDVSQVAVQQDNEAWISPLVENPLKTPFDRIKAEGRALELIAHWLLPLAQSLCVSSDIPDPETSSSSKAITKARDILVTELTSPPTLYALARAVGMSHTRLNRDFKKTYGKTVFDWLRGYRLQLAKTYLQDKQHSITSIAHLCGFSSASHFTQTFRQNEGCTPVVYRARLNKETPHVD